MNAVPRAGFRWFVGTCLVALIGLTPGPVALGQTDTHCAAGQVPMFGAGFAALREQLGAVMGTPTTCEYPDPGGTGDVEQNTTTGLAFWRKSSNTPVFTNGIDHWALTSGGLTHWTGSDVDPPSETATANGGFSPFVGVWAGHGRALEVRSDGAAAITYRTYRVCGQDPPPCDNLTGNDIVDGGFIAVQLESGSPAMAFGSIVSSSDPSYPVGTTTTFALDAHDAVLVRIGETVFANFCGPTSPIGYCGA